MSENGKSENAKPRKNLTTRQGHPVYDNQNQRTGR